MVKTVLQPSNWKRKKKCEIQLYVWGWIEILGYLGLCRKSKESHMHKRESSFLWNLDMFLSMYCICLTINFCSNKTLHTQGSKINFWVVKYVSYPGVSCIKIVLLQVLKGLSYLRENHSIIHRGRYYNHGKLLLVQNCMFHPEGNILLLMSAAVYIYLII